MSYNSPRDVNIFLIHFEQTINYYVCMYIYIYTHNLPFNIKKYWFRAKVRSKARPPKRKQKKLKPTIVSSIRFIRHLFMFILWSIEYDMVEKFYSNLNDYPTQISFLTNREKMLHCKAWEIFLKKTFFLFNETGLFLARVRLIYNELPELTHVGKHDWHF